jgi:hypothetical protein
VSEFKEVQELTTALRHLGECRRLLDDGLPVAARAWLQAAEREIRRLQDTGSTFFKLVPLNRP